MSDLEQEIGKLVLAAVEKAFTAKHNEALQDKTFVSDGTQSDVPSVELTALPSAEKMTQTTPSCGHYYLDEAGDATIFGDKGRVIIGTEGCSRFAMLGLLEVEDPHRLTEEMGALRASLIHEPYFHGVPSFDPAQRRTSLFFHAKDDLPEVRREVFHLLLRHSLSFSAVINDKQAVLTQFVRPREAEDPEYRYHPNSQYDYQVRCLFQGRLHKKPSYHIHFASRGKSDRTAALRAALETHQQEMNAKWNIAEASALHVSVHKPWEQAGLQAVDYFLWALQRLYEREEERFIHLLHSKVSVINDRNDRRKGRGGTHYTRKRPLTLATLSGAKRDEKNLE